MAWKWWLAVVAAGVSLGQQRGIVLADLTWVEAEKALRPETVVVIPIGAESKEHGPHLKLKTDYLEAEYYTRQVLERADVVVAPTVNYSFYPAFVEYPGSTTLRLETARDMLVDICGIRRHARRAAHPRQRCVEPDFDRGL